MDTYSASARATFGRIPGFLREWVDSAPEVDSRPPLLSSWPRTSSTTAVPFFFTGFAGDGAPRAVFPTFALSQNGEVCTVDASAAEQFFPRKPGLFFFEPLVFCNMFSCPKAPLGDFLEPSTTKSSSSSRAWGGGDAGSQTPGCSATPLRCTLVSRYRQRRRHNILSAPQPPHGPVGCSNKDAERVFFESRSLWTSAAWSNRIREDLSSHLDQWLRPDSVLTAPYLVCKPQRV